MSKKQQIALLALVVILVLGGACLGSYYYRQIMLRSADRPKVCTMEAKLCPDGSAVGRSGANCEFAECPKAVEDQKACRTAEDCACGTKINTNECFFGNRKYVNIEKQCPDYCTGITGRLMIGCVDGLCQQIDKK